MAERFSADYHVPHLAHASMEPPVATVQIRGVHAEVWTSVQNPTAAQRAVATRLKIKPENVKVNVLLLGGGFGRKSKPDFVDEAVIVAQAMPAGTPVKLVWTREDDIHHDYLHTVSVERLEAVLSKTGQVQSWLHRSAAPTIASLFTEGAKGQQLFESAMSAINMPYRIPTSGLKPLKCPHMRESAGSGRSPIFRTPSRHSASSPNWRIARARTTNSLHSS